MRLKARSWLFVAVCASGILGGCSKPETSSAVGAPSALAVPGDSDSSSPIELRPTSKDIDEVKKVRLLLEQVDRKYPPPETPSIPPTLYGVVSVSADGTISLDNGSTIRLDGLKCSEEGNRLISRMLLGDPDSRIAFIHSPSSASTPKPVDIWLVDFSSDIDGKRVSGYSRVADAALINGWCKPVPASTGEIDPRYEAISDVAKELAETPNMHPAAHP